MYFLLKEGLLLFFTALAQEAPVAASSAARTPSVWESFLVPMGAFFLIFYFLVLRPQARKVRESQNFLGGLKKGDQVLTSGGVLGVIVGMTDTFVDLKIADGIKIKVVKSTLTPFQGTSKSSLDKKEKNSKKTTSRIKNVRKTGVSET